MSSFSFAALVVAVCLAASPAALATTKKPSPPPPHKAPPPPPPAAKAPWAYTDGNVTRFADEVIFLTNNYLGNVPDLNVSDYLDPAFPIFPNAVPVADSAAADYDLDFSTTLALATDTPGTFTIGLPGSVLYVPTVFPEDDSITDGTGAGVGTYLTWEQFNATTITLPGGTRAVAFNFLTQPAFTDTKVATYLTWTITTINGGSISFDRVYTASTPYQYYGFLQDSGAKKDALDTVTVTVKKGFTTAGLVFANWQILNY